MLLVAPPFFRSGGVTYSTIWDTADQGGYSISSKVATASGASNRSVKGTVGFNTGKRYFEVACPSTSEWGAGFADKTTINPANRAGLYSISGGTWRGGTSNDKSVSGGGLAVVASGTPSFTSGYLGFAIDFALGYAWLNVNGTWFASGNPAGGTSPFISGLSGTFYPAGSSSATSRVLTLKTKLAEFSTAPPSGFSSWDGD